MKQVFNLNSCLLAFYWIYMIPRGRVINLNSILTFD